jgi:hypothetical protein
LIAYSKRYRLFALLAKNSREDGETKTTIVLNFFNLPVPSRAVGVRVKRKATSFEMALNIKLFY